MAAEILTDEAEVRTALQLLDNGFPAVITGVIFLATGDDDMSKAEEGPLVTTMHGLLILVSEITNVLNRDHRACEQNPYSLVELELLRHRTVVEGGLAF